MHSPWALFCASMRCQFASLYLLTEPRGWNSFWLKRAETDGEGGWRGGWEDKKTEMRKERLKRGVSGEMEWYVARHRPIRRHWERTATDKRRTIGRKKSRNQTDMPGAFIKDNVVLSLNRGYMLRGVRYKPHLSFFQPFKYESACECACVCVLSRVCE